MLTLDTVKAICFIKLQSIVEYVVVMSFVSLVKLCLICWVLIFPGLGWCLSVSVDPGITTTGPAIMLGGFSTGSLTITYSDIEAGTEVSPPKTMSAPVPDGYRIDLPNVDRRVYHETVVRQEGVSEPVFAWRTLLLPKGERLVDYPGPKELAPPPDFPEYWKRARAELAKVPANARVTRLPDQDSTTGLLYRVELDSVNETTFVGFFFVPRAAYEGGDPEKGVVKKYPAIILTPGYGGEQRPVDRTDRGYITFSTNPRNHGPSRAYWKSPVEHQLFNIEDPENYYYKLAVLDCLRAAEFVLNRPETDVKAVGCEGSSQGGYLALATAANEPRIACVAANVIAFSDYPDGSILATKGGQVRVRELLAAKTTATEAIKRSLIYTDGANLATQVECPVQICMGGRDPVCPYVCGLVVLNKLPMKDKREFRIVPDAKHEVTPEMRRWNAEWFDRWLKGTAL